MKSNSIRKKQIQIFISLKRRENRTFRWWILKLSTNLLITIFGKNVFKPSTAPLKISSFFLMFQQRNLFCSIIFRRHTSFSIQFYSISNLFILNRFEHKNNIKKNTKTNCTYCVHCPLMGKFEEYNWTLLFGHPNWPNSVQITWIRLDYRIADTILRNLLENIQLCVIVRGFLKGFLNKSYSLKINRYLCTSNFKNRAPHTANAWL